MQSKWKIPFQKYHLNKRTHVSRPTNLLTLYNSCINVINTIFGCYNNNNNKVNKEMETFNVKCFLFLRNPNNNKNKNMAQKSLKKKRNIKNITFQVH